MNDVISVHGAQARLGFRTDSSQKPLDLLLRATTVAQAQHAIHLQSTSFAGGGDSVSFDGARARVSYAHQGPPTAFQFTLTGSGVGAAGTFRSPPLAIGDGETALIAPSRWSDLGSTQLDLTITSADGTTRRHSLRNRALPAAGLEVELEAERAGDLQADLELETEIEELVPGSTALISFAVLDSSREPVATHSIAVPAGELREGERAYHWQFGPAVAGHYEVAVLVQILAPDGSATARSARRRFKL